MSLKDDIAAMREHERNGTLKEFMRGEKVDLPYDPGPPDNTDQITDLYAWIAARGD